MRLGGRLAAAIEILDDMQTRHRPASDALRNWGISHRFAGSGDRSAIGNIVYDALRLKASSTWRFGEDTGRAQAFGALLTGLGMTAETIAVALDGDKFAPEPLSDAEIAAWDAANLADAPDHVRAECPQWCAPLFEAAFGENWIAEVRALAERPPLDMRVNTLKASREKVLKALTKTLARPFDGLDNALRIPPVEKDGRHPNITVEGAYIKGLFEVQDCGSQMVAEIGLPDLPGQVLDLCAGAGGKTLAMAAAMENKGQIHAYDADKMRLAPIFDRLKRAGTRNVQVHGAGSDLSTLEGQMDMVLADAPCTGTGTWRRRPDIKWRLAETSLDDRMAEQAAVLDEAAQYVKPGGRLVYITCSLFAPENTGQIAAFLERNAGFVALNTMDLAKAKLPEAATAMREDGAGGLLLTPATSGTDGFFIAALQRKA